jgi:hypothetical protein
MTSPAPHEEGWTKAVQRRPTAKQQGWEAGQFCLASTSHPEPTLPNPANPMNSEAGWCREVGLDWHWECRAARGTTVPESVVVRIYSLATVDAHAKLMWHHKSVIGLFQSFCGY